MRAVFGELAFLARCVEVEAALARAQARLGIVPAEAARRDRGRAANLERDSIVDLLAPRDRDRRLPDPAAGAPARRDAPATPGAGCIGARRRRTSWTPRSCCRSATALALIEADLADGARPSRGLARRYRDTPMAGRTHLQHALPITFGYKAAVWLAGFDRHAERLAELRPRVLVGQFGGAAGTLASLGEGHRRRAARAGARTRSRRAADHLACRARRRSPRPCSSSALLGGSSARSPST